MSQMVEMSQQKTSGLMWVKQWSVWFQTSFCVAEVMWKLQCGVSIQFECNPQYFTFANAIQTKHRDNLFYWV